MAFHYLLHLAMGHWDSNWDTCGVKMSLRDDKWNSVIT
jgi:hypothetical protein